MAGAKTEGCVLCGAAHSGKDDEELVIHRGEHNFVILNRFPYNSGHLMVVPYEHQSEFTRLTQEQLGEMMELAQAIIEAYQDCLRPEGVNLGINLGHAAGAGIAEHVHLHLVPRWTGDTNFMTVMAETRVVPQALTDGAAMLGPALRERLAARREAEGGGQAG